MSVSKQHPLPLSLPACLRTHLSSLAECCTASVYSGCKKGLQLPVAAPRVPCGTLRFAVAAQSLSLHSGKCCSLLTAMEGTLLLQALRKARGKLLEGLQGMWCDAIPLLIETEWPRARGALLQPHAPFTAHAVQAWMQVGAQAGSSSTLL